MKHIILYIGALCLFVFLLAVGTTLDLQQIYLLPKAIFKFDSNSLNDVIWMELRMPRLILAFFTGAALGLSGYLMQVLVRNPLADPYVLGSSSGASLFAAIFYIWLAPGSASLSLLLLLTFTGAFGTNILSLFLSNVNGRIVPYRMILVGIAISSLAIALLSLLLYTSGADQSWKNIIFWTFGSFQTASWEKVMIMIGVVGMITLPATVFFNAFRIMELGEENANRIGVPVQRYRMLLLVLSSLLTGAAVSMVGPIGFIGLIMPHVIRMVFKYKQTRSFIFWLCYLSGLFLMICEILSNQLFPPQGIPAGILMSLIGVPFFLYLLLHTSDKNI